MVKTVFALALLAMSGTALAVQQQPAPAQEATEVMAPAEEVDAAADAQAAEAEEATVAPTAEEDRLSDKENYRAAVKALSRCRQNARRDNTPAAAVNSCGSQRKRMMAAKEALRDSK
jgi:hypothetical protein